MHKAILFLIVTSLLGSGCSATDPTHQGEDATPRIAVPTAAMPARPTPILAPTAAMPARPAPILAPTAAMPARPTPILAPEVPASKAEVEVRAAKADLARRLDVDADAIDLVSVTAWEWPDASLGVPEKGRIYVPVVTPGYIIVLEAQGQEHEYHADTHGRVVYASPGLIAR